MELEKYHGWVDDAQDNVYARSEDVRLTLSPTVAEAAHKSLRIRARSSSRLTVPELKQLLDYLGCGAEVQNYDRASLTVKVTMHRDGTVLTLPLEMVGRNEERCPWLKKLKADEFPKPEPAPAAAGAMPAGMYGGYPQMMMGGYPQQMIMQQQMMYQQQMAYQQQMMAAGYGYPAQQQQQQAAPPAAAAAAAAPALPAGWTSAVDPSSGRTYYCNTATKQTTWEHPAAPAQPAAAQPAAAATTSPTASTASAGSPTAAAATASSTPAAGAPAAAATSGDAAATAPAAAAPAAPAPTPAPLPEVRTS